MRFATLLPLFATLTLAFEAQSENLLGQKVAPEQLPSDLQAIYHQVAPLVLPEEQQDELFLKVEGYVYPSGNLPISDASRDILATYPGAILEKLEVTDLYYLPESERTQKVLSLLFTDRFQPYFCAVLTNLQGLSGARAKYVQICRDTIVELLTKTFSQLPKDSSVGLVDYRGNYYGTIREVRLVIQSKVDQKAALVIAFDIVHEI